MNKRNTQQRRHSIINLLNAQGEVSVEELSLRFETSEVTIRKDLATLEKSGLLLRRYGGAVAVPDEVIQSFSSKIAPNKLSIAKAAAQLINDHNRIIIDSGSTTAGLIAQLNNKRGLLVMTNSLLLANAIQELENEPTLLMTGGTWDPHSESFQGQIAEQVLRSYNFDQLFIGADGIDLARGTTTFNELTGLSKVMAEVSREVVVMLESEKIGRRIPNLELPWSNISVFVSDDRLPQQAVNSIEQHGVKVILAPYVDSITQA
ncbi:DeoR/GlpR family DNA-binding transcription regulator [Shewanella intestini]|uniref:DeoR/GlpR transcriptional regulator n=1 Tax=Shewanella intestini TaxID=2017544 RepID=A0ABS5I4Y8_9GAMM|nr:MULTISPECIES: DeoR/GlpR family DNA-binding transcription regulator [Shewanella]MBR9728898.1 DeoR/GlpR transcriptional regulator [Shewanella intestini]MRG37036.1 DeoR family transcriptional regulator [Shewanella sp. XMDDZSB0408]